MPKSFCASLLVSCPRYCVPRLCVHKLGLKAKSDYFYFFLCLGPDSILHLRGIASAFHFWGVTYINQHRLDSSVIWGCVLSSLVLLHDSPFLLLFYPSQFSVCFSYLVKINSRSYKDFLKVSRHFSWPYCVQLSSLLRTYLFANLKV